jgi:hypothetical protein
MKEKCYESHSIFVVIFFNFFSNFCIIEGPETVQDFVQMQLREIQNNIRSRRNKIFLLMEEVKFVKFLRVGPKCILVKFHICIFGL